MTRLIPVTAVTILSTLFPLAASAHVVVRPAEVGVAAFQTFTTGVPNEKDQDVTGLRLVIPGGLKYVSPNVKPGWTIAEKTSGNGEDTTVTEISWTGGQIPASQRDDFLFSAQAPAQAGELHWKAYQTYADGTVVAWDQAPGGKDDASQTPYSSTEVIDDLAHAAVSPSVKSDGNANANVALGVAVVALILSLLGLRRKRG